MKTNFVAPHVSSAGVMPVYLNIEKPLDTGNIPTEVVEKLRDVARRDRTRLNPNEGGRDPWDKERRTAKEWFATLEDDIANSRTHAWTSVPEKITKALEEMGYDGIKDTGGKMGGVANPTWIAFRPDQI